MIGTNFEEEEIDIIETYGPELRVAANMTTKLIDTGLTPADFAPVKLGAKDGKAAYLVGINQASAV